MSLNRKRRFSSSSSSLDIIGFNEDIMTEISLYLPVKSILCFRSVSKQWHSLLTHPQFIRRYATRKSRNSSLFFQLPSRIESLYLKGNHNFDMVDFGYLKNSCQDQLSLKQSCNGLLLFESKTMVRGQAQRRRFYVCNPSTRKYTELAVPDYIATLTKPSCLFFNLAFDPSRSPHYKAIFFWNNDLSTHNNYHTTIYSSETRTCRKLGFTFNSCDMLLCLGTFLNGAIHWACRPSKNALYFDINQESMRAFPRTPSCPEDDYYDIEYFGVCRDRLHLILGQGYRRYCQRVFDVYELKEDYSSWFPKYKVDFEAIAVDFPEIIIRNRDDNNSKTHYTYNFFVCVLEDEGNPTLVLSFKNQLLAYNFIDKTTRKLCDIPFRDGDSPNDQHIGKYILWYQTCHCIESLSGI